MEFNWWKRVMSCELNRLACRVLSLALFTFAVVTPPTFAQVMPESGSEISARPFGAVQVPNGYYTESREDMRVKVLGGHVVLRRTYWNRDINKTAGEWVFNPAWVDLKFTLDSIDGTVKTIDRGGQIYERSGGDLYVLDKRFFIKKVSSSQWRWYDQRGNYVLYDQSGKITEYGDRNNVKVSFTYNAQGLKDSIRDAANNLVLSFSYSGTKLIGVTDRASRSVQYTWTGNNLTRVKDAEDGVSTLSYDAKGNLSQILDEIGRALDLIYAGNRVVKMTTGGLETTMDYSYDKVARQSIVVTSAAGAAAIRALYNPSGRVVGMQYGDRTLYAMTQDGERTEVVVDERGYITRTEFDADRRPLRVVNPDGSSTSATYDSRWGTPLVTTDEAGVQTRYEYDGAGNLIKLTESLGTADERMSVMTYDSIGQMLTATRKGKNGNPDATVTYTYDGFGNRNSMTDAEGNRYEMTHDAMGNILTLKTPKAQTYTYVVNKRGWTTRRTDPIGGVTQFEYDGTGNLLKETDERGKSFQYRYNNQGRQTQAIDAYSKAFVTSYTRFGQVERETDEEGRAVALYNYNPQNYLQSYQDGKGNTTTLDYQNGASQQASPIGPAVIRYPTYEERMAYDNRFRLTQQSLVFDGDGITTSYSYDAKGNTISETDPNGKTTFFEYDSLNRPTKITNRVSAEIQMTYDERGNMTSLTDGKGNIHRLEYDRANRLTKEMLPLGQARTYTYDANSNIRRVTEANGQATEYEYDAKDRISTLKLFPAGVATANLIYTLGYDATDNLTSWSDGTHAGAFTYDDNGRKLSETVSYGNGVSLTYRYTYFANGFKKTMTYPGGSGVDGPVVTFGYDAHDEVNAIQLPGEGNIAVNSFKWTAPTGMTLPGGASQEMTRDGLLMLTSLKAKNTSSTVVADLVNRYNKLQDVTQRTLDGDVKNFSYDDERRITTVTGPTPENSTYDKADNRLTSALSGVWEYDANNRLTRRGNLQYDYDGAGNLIKKVDATNSGAPVVTLYRFDAMNRLLQVEDATGQPGSTTIGNNNLGLNGSVIARYAYDIQNRRLWKDVGGGKTLFLHADEGLIAQADAGGTLQKTFGWKPDGVFGHEPQWIRDHGLSQTAYFVNDHIGAPIRLMNSRGEIVWRGDYTSLGQFLPDTTLQAPASTPANASPPFALFEQPLRRPGQYEDTETGLYNNWNRMFDPQSGRYISQDPMGLSEGQNQYNYAEQNGQNMVDPDGRIVWVPIIMWAWRVTAIIDLYAQVRDGCFDMKQFMIDRIPVGKFVKRIKWKKKPSPKPKDPPTCPIPSGNSFAGDTVVHVWDEGSNSPATKPIRDIRLGDKVLAYSEWMTGADKDTTTNNVGLHRGQLQSGQTDRAANPLSYRPVTDIFSSHKQQTMVKLTLDTGEVIDATQGHPFKTDQGWRDAALLEVGSRIEATVSRPGLLKRAVKTMKGSVASLAAAAVLATTPAVSAAQVERIDSVSSLVHQVGDSAPAAAAERARLLNTFGTERFLAGVTDHGDDHDTTPIAHRTVTAVTKQNVVIPVYNLEVASAHTFFVGEEGALVHNGNGSYTCYFSNNKTYSGKGDWDRASTSGEERAAQNDTTLEFIDWTPAESKIESYLDEHDRIERNGGARNRQLNYNERNSPGKKLRRPKPPTCMCR
jgi:RHS repeat-associated protein